MTGRLEVERIVTEWLANDINAKITAVPKDAGDPVPPLIATYTDTSYPTTNSLAVFTRTVHPWVGDGVEPPAAPALYVMTQGPIIFDGEPYPTGQIRETESPLKLFVLYITGDADAAVARRNGDYTVRAIAQSLRSLSASYNQPDTTMVRNQISVVLGEQLTFYPVGYRIGNHRVTGAVMVGYKVRDGAP